jgi:hypothetical protein
MGVDFAVPRAQKGKKDSTNLVACCRPYNVLNGRSAFGSFEEAKAYVLGGREKLRNAWETRIPIASPLKATRDRHRE